MNIDNVTVKIDDTVRIEIPIPVMGNAAATTTPSGIITRSR